MCAYLVLNTTCNYGDYVMKLTKDEERYLEELIMIVNEDPRDPEVAKMLDAADELFSEEVYYFMVATVEVATKVYDKIHTPVPPRPPKPEKFNYWPILIGITALVAFSILTTLLG